MSRWQYIARIWYSDEEEPHELVLKEYRLRFTASLAKRFSGVSAAALAWIAYYNSLNPDHMIVGLEYDMREAL